MLIVMRGLVICLATKACSVRLLASEDELDDVAVPRCDAVRRRCGRCVLCDRSCPVVERGDDLGGVLEVHDLLDEVRRESHLNVDVFTSEARP